MANFSLQFANGGFRPGQKQKNLLAAEGDPLIAFEGVLEPNARGQRLAVRGPVGGNEKSSTFLAGSGHIVNLANLATSQPRRMIDNLKSSPTRRC